MHSKISMTAFALAVTLGLWILSGCSGLDEYEDVVEAEYEASPAWEHMGEAPFMLYAPICEVVPVEGTERIFVYGTTNGSRRDVARGGYDPRRLYEFDPTTGHLTARPGLPLDLSAGARSAVLGNQIWIAGRKADTNRTQLIRWEPVTGDWRVLPVDIDTWAGFGFAACNDELFFIGGSINGVPTTAVRSYNSETGRMTLRKDLTAAGGGFPPHAVTVNGRLYALIRRPTEGWDGGEITLHAYDPKSDQWEPKATHKPGRPPLRAIETCVVGNLQIFVTEGNDLRARSNYSYSYPDSPKWAVDNGDRVHEYDVATDCWYERGVLPAGDLNPYQLATRFGYNGAYFETKLYFFGGREVRNQSGGGVASSWNHFLRRIDVYTPDKDPVRNPIDQKETAHARNKEAVR